MSFQFIIGIAIPAITFFLMTTVGMDLTTDDFRKVRQAPRGFFIGTLGQFLLPLCAWLTLELLKPIPAIAGGMILIASAPGGGISNYYTYLARCNVALSVVLTTVSCVGAAVTMPVLLRLFDFLLPQRALFHVPLTILFGQLFLLLVIPVVTGFLIRFYKPMFVAKHKKALQWAGFVALGALIAFIFYQTRDMFLASWHGIVIAAGVFILFSMMLGYALGSLFGLNRSDAFTLLIELGVRNVAITTTTAVVILKHAEFATFAAIYFLVEAALILSAIVIFRKLINL